MSAPITVGDPVDIPTRPATSIAPRLTAPQASAARPPVSLDTMPSPRLELDVAAALRQFVRIRNAFGDTEIHYAVKANPHPELLRALAAADASFDVASPAEVQAVIAAGAPASSCIHSNPVARRDHLIACAEMGVTTFVVDSPSEVAKLAQVAPGATTVVRILTSGAGSDWPLSRKYGCTVSEAVDILVTAKELGLDVAGVCFHVGSQQRDPGAWVVPVTAAAMVFRQAKERGVDLRLLDLGGGLPAHLDGGAPPVERYAAAIDAAIGSAFADRRPRTLLEPGRGIVADAGEVVGTVIGVIERAHGRWVFLDVGVFTGLVETLDEAIRYPITTSVDGGPSGPCVLAGPTCDSTDVLYEKRLVDLPLSLAEGDTIRLSAAGAYTTCYSSVGFNGFDPLPTVLVGPWPRVPLGSLPVYPSSR